MRNTVTFLAAALLFGLAMGPSCTDTTGGDPTPTDPPTDPPTDGTPTPTASPTDPPAQLPTDVRNYIFGHSLLLHSDTANVPRWLHAFSADAGYSYGFSGQYGFADTHAANLPPFAQWGVPGTTVIWDDDDGQSFGDVNFNTVLFTEANFRQYYPPTQPDPDGFLPESTVASTTTVADWVEAAEPGIRFVIYENWPDMAGYTSADFSATYPSPQELASYHAFTAGDFHDWWVDYHDGMLAARPNLNIKMIPVGSIMADLLTGTLSAVPPEVLYEDDAPHGTPTLYFIAGIITYAGVYGRPPPDDYGVPMEIDAAVRDAYPTLLPEIMDSLRAFNDADGNSRVW